MSAKNFMISVASPCDDITGSGRLLSPRLYLKHATILRPPVTVVSVSSVFNRQKVKSVKDFAKNTLQILRGIWQQNVVCISDSDKKNLNI